ncbi:hypothetical protein BAE44_0001366 [Dichanthelium oligosanthes]|uniref:Uncharacterized protein n=1 Tax=Dichanthelium oligosanthes TaxID=888268 RepID=A0A1E5WJQ0_9POAL|nr:hypothetical protein BAE44_0001366 [Dichanthelium oligosanthes]
MWGCYVNSLKALSSLQATVTNFAANFISSGLAGYFLFHEPLPSKDSFFDMEMCLCSGLLVPVLSFWAFLSSANQASRRSRTRIRRNC